MRRSISVLLFLFTGTVSHAGVYVPEGHIGIAAINGEILPETIAEGTHETLNPEYDWFIFDLSEQAYVDRVYLQPSAEAERNITIVVSVRFKLIPERLPDLLRLSGSKILSDPGFFHPRVHHVVGISLRHVEQLEDLHRPDVREYFNEMITKQLRGRVKRGLAMEIIEARIVYFRIRQGSIEPTF